MVDVSFKHQDPYIWQGIIATKDKLVLGFNFVIGQGDASLWYDSWLRDGPLCHKISFVHFLEVDMRMRDIIYNDS